MSGSRIRPAAPLSAVVPPVLRPRTFSQLRAVLFAVALLPLARLVYLGATGGLGANPVEFVIRSLEEQGLLRDASFWLSGVQFLILIGLLVVSISLLYYFGTREGRKISFFSPGTILTIVLFIVNFLIFRFYLEKFAQYNQLYGSIGTVLVIMLFIWLNSIILLLGFELNTSLLKLHHRNLEENT